MRQASGDLTDPDNWWTAYAQDYAGRTWKSYRDLLSEYIRHAEGGPLLDVGCGYGFLVECARQFGIVAVGLEAAENALERGRALHPLADIRSWKGGEPLPIESESMAGAMLNEFVDHITIEQNRLLFRELGRVLKPGGTLMVKSPSRYNSFDQDAGHVTFFSPSEFKVFVQGFSFEVIEQPFVPQPFLGTSRAGRLAMRGLTTLFKPEAWTARNDLVARKAPRVRLDR